MSTNKLKINIFGEAWRLKRLTLSDELLQTFEKTARGMRQPLTEVIIDPFFYHHLKSKTIQSIEDLQGNSTDGLINSVKNQIEIWYRNKKVQKLKINDLNDDLLLFPLYNTTIQKINTSLEKGIYFEQREIGLIGCFEVYIGNFNIDNLEFQLLQAKEHLLLQKMIYENQILISKKQDTLITFQNCFEVV